MPFDERTRMLVGDSGMERLALSSVALFGLGGVGAAAASDLVRAGVGRIVAVDFDTVSESNLNRLAFGTSANVGLAKTAAFEAFAKSVNPDVAVETASRIVRGAEADAAIPGGCDYYLDCIDTLNPKVNLIIALLERALPFASSMGTAGRLAPERLRLASIWETAGCPLAQKVRQRLRRRGFADPREAPKPGTREAAFPCVFSDEPPVAPRPPADGGVPGEIRDGVRIRAVQGSGPFVPQAAGHILASVAVRSILGIPLREPRTGERQRTDE